MFRPTILACALVFVACSSNDDDAGSGGASTADAGPDVAAEAVAPDVAADVISEATPDGPEEAATDATQETSTDAPEETSTDAAQETSTDAAGADAPADVATDVGPVTSCGEIPALECFANNECAAADRCEDVGPGGTPVPCCVPGARGSGQAGDSCVDENDCESGVCVAGIGPYMCSTTCNTASECPLGMKNCTYIAFSGSDDMWCLPTN